MSYKLHKVKSLPERGEPNDWYLLKKEGEEFFSIHIAQMDGVLVNNGYTVTQAEVDKLESLPTKEEMDMALGRKANKLQSFRELILSSSDINIDHSLGEFFRVELKNNDVNTYLLSFTNVPEGGSGKILVVQGGNKRIELSPEVKGKIDLPISKGATVIVEYTNVGGVVYLTSVIVSGNFNTVSVSKITDLSSVYSDNQLISMKWTAPFAETENEPVTYYDIRYANNEVNPNDPKEWLSMKPMDSGLVPRDPKQTESYVFVDLKPDTEYFIYVKGVKIIKGVYSYGEPSNLLKVKTKGVSSLGSAPYTIPVYPRGLNPQVYNYLTLQDGSPTNMESMIDEKEKNVFLPSGFPDLLNRNYSTYWFTYKYGRNTYPFYFDIDLYQSYVLDKVYLYCPTKLKITLYGSRGFGSTWEKIGEGDVVYNGWATIECGGKDYRMLRIAYDRSEFGARHTPSVDEGEPVFPNVEYGVDIEPIGNLIISGKPGTRPDGIHEPMRRYTTKRTVDEFFCTNGHLYQPGRIHAACGGSKTRLYIHFGHFSQFDAAGNLKRVNRFTDLRFRLDKVPWVYNNGGLSSIPDTGVGYILQDTYKRYGQKPFLCNTGVFDICAYRGQGERPSPHNRPIDNYWYPGAWYAMPKRGVDGLTDFYKVTKSPESYKTYTMLAEALAAKYGSNKDVRNLTMPHDNQELGLDLISGLEMENEPDQNWNDWIGYSSSEEFAAITSAVTDGHVGTLLDEDGNILKGIKTDPNMLAISGGTAGVNKGYLFSAYHWWAAHRKDGKSAPDVMSLHHYFSNAGNQDAVSSNPTKYGIPVEEFVETRTEDSFVTALEMRDRISPKTEVWLTEFGWGEAGGRDTISSLQTHSLSGRVVDGWTIPDRHRSEVKGAWIVRATFFFMEKGIDLVNYYSTETEGDYFRDDRYGTGAAYEMWDWYNLTDNTPGAKNKAIEEFEVKWPRTGFASMGLFGNILTNGGYPIMNAFWWTATMRNTLKGFVFTGKIAIKNLPRVIVYTFYNATTDKSAYAIYHNSRINTGEANVEIPLPSSAAYVDKVSVYIPQITDPRKVPNDLGNDEDRTGLPTSRRERFEGGKWVTINRAISGNRLGSITSQPSIYPSNPVEGQEHATLPSKEENPYFPIVGPICEKRTPNGINVSAGSYERKVTGNEYELAYNNTLPWRQVDAILDYIEYHPEGKKGTSGITTRINKSNNGFVTNVSEFPDYYIFDGKAIPDFDATPKDLSSVPINGTTVDLWWNNTNVEDEAYELFMSKFPDAGYEPYSITPVSSVNKITVKNLEPNTTYYFKLRAIKGNQTSELSEYVSAKTFSELESPTDLRSTGRTTTSIALEWDYPSAQSSDFLYFSLERSHSGSSFVEVAKISNINVKTYNDFGLGFNTFYNYRVRVVGLMGISDFSEVFSTRTALPEEMPPAVKTLATDKLGTGITINFDVEVALTNGDKSFIVEVATSEDSYTVIDYESVIVNPANPMSVQIRFNREALPSYDSGKLIYLTYTGDNVENTSKTKLEPFEREQVRNNTYNFTGVSNTWYVNLTNDEVFSPEPWNNLTYSPTTVTFPPLKNKSGEVTLLTVTQPNTSSRRWGSYSGTGLSSIPENEVPSNSIRTSWTTAFGASINGNTMARLSIDGLDPSKVYKIQAYSGSVDTDSTLKKPIRMEIGSKVSNSVEGSLNRAEYMTIDGIATTDGKIDIDFRTLYADGVNNTIYCGVNWLIIEERENPEGAENREVLLRDFDIEGGVNYEGSIISDEVMVVINTVGKFTKYKISETPDLSQVEWVNIDPDTGSKVPFTFKNKQEEEGNLYVIVGNTFNDSSVIAKPIKKKLIFGLSKLYVNIPGLSSYTTKRNIKVGLAYTGNATEYRIGEGSLTNLPWLPIENEVDVLLSEGVGIKQVVAEVRNSEGQVASASGEPLTLLSSENEHFYFDFDTNAEKNKVKATRLQDGTFCNTMMVIGNNTNPNYGSHPLVNNYGEETDIYVHFNTAKYPLDAGSSIRNAYSDLLARTDLSATADTFSKFPAPLPLIPSCIFPNSSNLTTNRGRINMYLPAGVYRLKALTSVPSVAQAQPAWTNTRAVFEIADAVTHDTIAKETVGPTSFNAVLNTEYNVSFDFTITEGREVSLQFHNGGYANSPLFNAVVLTRNPK